MSGFLLSVFIPIQNTPVQIKGVIRVSSKKLKKKKYFVS